MLLHKEGRGPLISFAIILIGINAFIALFGGAFSLVSVILSALFYLGVLNFFRYEPRKHSTGDQEIVCPADGRVVVVEETGSLVMASSSMSRTMMDASCRLTCLRVARTTSAPRSSSAPRVGTRSSCARWQEPSLAVSSPIPKWEVVSGSMRTLASSSSALVSTSICH